MLEVYEAKNRDMKQLSKSNIKLKAFQSIFILLFISFLLFLFLPKNYTKKYIINKVEITERFDKKNKDYYFTLKYKDTTFDYLVESKYYKNRGLITKIEVVEENDDFCLVPTGKKLDYIPLCLVNNEIVHYNKASDELKSKIGKRNNSEKKLETYKDIEIYNKDFTYLLWNYDGFYFINKDSSKKISIFDKETYNINLVGYTKDYLVIADYNSNYTFNNFYTIDLKKGNLKKQELNRNIYFDSYFIGYEKNNLYIVDNKEHLMYEFDAKKGKIDKMRSKVITNGKWENVNINTLLNNKQEFSYHTNYEYTLENNNLYLKYKDKETKKLITDNVTSLVRIKDKDIFYLKTDSLYHFNEITGEEKLLTYFEWNFNSNNMIYIN